ncbi:hypothetical protein K388_06666 [Streptomyces sp. KhCrAH-43]|nr:MULTISPECIES: hypothetical protein [unclassified Streptomyces]MYS33441.1 hypothetical protein [Streptomyces sp. SID4920]MYX65784.1 hypothetical protein [Streptomyces sp. SID8373]RAJ49748.1 hypothetical protein K388_06666 [Streptomyces sp. KhCrAH-43]
MPHPVSPTPPRPDYADTSLGFVYTWIRHADGRDAAYGARLLEQMAEALEEYARARGARLIGHPQFDFPAPTSLPRPIQREVRRALLAQERRPWHWPGLTLVRIWQDTEPAGRD